MLSAPESQCPVLASSQFAWIDWIIGESSLCQIAVSPQTNPECASFRREAAGRADAIVNLLENYLPWLLPQFAALRVAQQLGINQRSFELNCAGALEFAKQLQFTLTTAHRTLGADQAVAEARDGLLTLLPAAIANLKSLLADLQRISREAERLALDMDFSFLVDPGRRILSIGFEAGTQRRSDSCTT